MIDTAIIADDLTGACDTGVKLMNLGYETEVIIDSDNCSSLTKNKSHIFSVNTNTRSVNPDEAYRRVRQAVEDVKKKGIDRFYKKVDSVLRGNIGREIDAMFDAMDYELAIIAPALPDNGIIINNGKLYDCKEYSPIAIHKLIAKDVVCSTTARSCGMVDLSIIRQGKDAIKSKIAKLYAEGNTIILLDTEVNEDLALIAKAINEIEFKTLPVGSAGLIRFLWPSQNDYKALENNAYITKAAEARILVAAGSIHPATIAQIQQLNKRDDISTCTFSVKDITSENAYERVEELVGNVIKEFICTGESFGIMVTTEQILKGDFSDDKRVLYKDVSNPIIADSIAEITSWLTDALKINMLIATGGDTANRVFNKVGIKQIKLLAEPIPGIAVGIGTLNSGRKLLLATKSGGFGDEKALDVLVNYMCSIKVMD